MYVSQSMVDIRSGFAATVTANCDDSVSKLQEVRLHDHRGGEALEVHEGQFRSAASPRALTRDRPSLQLEDQCDRSTQTCQGPRLPPHFWRSFLADSAFTSSTWASRCRGSSTCCSRGRSFRPSWASSRASSTSREATRSGWRCIRPSELSWLQRNRRSPASHAPLLAPQRLLDRHWPSYSIGIGRTVGAGPMSGRGVGVTSGIAAGVGARTVIHGTSKVHVRPRPLTSTMRPLASTSVGR